MTDHDGEQSERASTLQEAVDVLVSAFDYPTKLSVEYAVEAGTKRTLFEVTARDESATYELSYDGRSDDSEPMLVRRDEAASTGEKR